MPHTAREGFLYCMDPPALSPYARLIAEPVILRERWSDVSALEFEAFLRDYPRPLEARPPLGQKGNYREWRDPTYAKTGALIERQRSWLRKCIGRS